jgi:predicted MFS family arabinose efflux permease
MNTTHVSSIMNAANAALRIGKWYAVLILMFANAVNILDRIIFNVLLQPIKTEFALSDFSTALLTTLPFALLYAPLAIPVALLADRTVRRNVVAAALVVFSGMTVFCGLSTSFAQLFVARMGVVIGEAGCSPAAQSMISDICKPEERGRGMGVFASGLNLGMLLGLLLGGWTAQLWGWRAALFIAGVPGLLVAVIIVATLKEPPRDLYNVYGVADRRAGLLDVLRFLFGQRSFRHMASGIILSMIPATALFVWTPSYLARSYGMKSGEIGTVLALIFGLLGALAAFSYAWLSDRLRARDIRWQVWLPALCCLISLPFMVAMPFTHAASSALLVLVLPILFFSAYVGPLYGVTHFLVRNNMRATASAIVLAIITIGGQTLGGQTVGWLSDVYHARMGAESLRFAIMTTAAFLPWASIHFWLAGKTLHQNVQLAMAAGTS